MLETEYFGKREIVTNQWHIQVEEAKINGTPSPIHPGFEPFPTEEDIIKKAETLNGFVSQSQPVVTKSSKK